jgi:serine/threonine kinase 4
VIEMAEGEPPYFHVHPMRVLFMIGTNPPPTLSRAELWSAEMKDFLSCCLVKDPSKRPSAKQLLKVRDLSKPNDMSI